MHENHSELPEFSPPQKFNLKKFSLYKLTKNNFTLFLLTPTLIGGLYQIWQLTNIELSFIRFFSVSQVVSDGLMILIGILLILFSIIYIGLILYIMPKIKETDSTIKKILKISFIFLIGITLTKLNLMDTKATLANEVIILLALRLSMIFIVFYFIYESGKIIYLLFKEKNKITYNNFLKQNFTKYKRKIEIAGILALSLIIFIIGSSIYSLLMSFNNYNRIENFKVIEQIIKDNSPIEIEPKIVFYNKDYLFINLNLVKSCRCDIEKNCTKKHIYDNTKWIENKYRVIDGKGLMEIYK